MRKKLFFISFSFILFGCYKSEKADLVVHNAKIYSVDQNMTVYQAMAIKNGKIIELGPEQQIMNKYQANRFYNAATKPIYPGFIDSHCHFLAYGLSLQRVNLVGTTSFEEVIEKVKAFREENPDLTWIIGRGWDQNDWEAKEFPTNTKLNELFPDVPVLLSRVDGHAALVNQKALDLANLNVESSIDGGKFLKNENGLTGVLIDNAVDLVKNIIPNPSIEEKIKALIHAEENCFAAGITTVDEAGLDKKDVLLIDSLQKIGLLNIRCYAMLNPTDENYEMAKDSIYKTDRLNIRSFKIYADGALGSRGAKLIDHYHDKHDHSGMLLADTSYFKAWAKKCHQLGFQMNTHCIGDGANRLLLNIYGSQLNGANDLRWRIEHAQVVQEKDFELFGKFSIIPSVQPTHATSDMYWAQDRLGETRMTGAYAYQKLLQQNGILPLGTDFPVEGIYPIETFYAAIARKDKKGYPESGFQIDNALSRENALKGMTIFGALGNFEENEKGSLEVGKLADFVVLDMDIMECTENKILPTNVITTFVNGEIVFE